MRIRGLSDKEAIAASQNIKERDYWLAKLSGEWEKSRFLYDYDPDSSEQPVERPPGHVKFKFSADISAQLIKLSNKSDHRLYMILVTAVKVLLYKYTGHKDIIIGVPIYKQKIQGDFINTVLVLRNRFDDNITFKELLLQVRQTIFDAAQHQNYPIKALIDILNLPVEKNDFPFFDTAILLENVHDRNYLDRTGANLLMSFLKIAADPGSAGDDIIGNWEYNAALYRKSTIEGIVSHLTHLLGHALPDVNIKISDIEILSPGEKQQLLVDFNNTGGEYPEGQTIHQWFEEQVGKTPDNIAVLNTGHQAQGISPGTDSAAVTYLELNEKSNQLAHQLREKGVGPDIIVGITAERSLEMIIGLLAILKAGGAYLPIDPQYPEERRNYMLFDSGVRLVLTTYNRDRLGNLTGKLEIIDLYTDGIYCGERNNLPHMNRATDLVYLIYTSGSTGKPKGVLIEHKNVVNLIYFDFFHANIDCSKILQFHTLSFDASFHEIFCALLSGGTLVLIREDTRADIPELLRLVEKTGIKTLFMPMSFLKLIFSEDDYIRGFPDCVQHIQTAGEQVVINHGFRRFLQENSVYLHNHYGPSETHVVTALTLNPAGEIPGLPSIGKPILNTGIYILDRQMNLLPVGIGGELYIGGVQVGRGYLDNPQLTAERFVNHYSPYSPYSTIYRTGDLARWQGDGNIEFLGRIDNQVKIRGFRVEPGEIESRLLNHEKIKEAVVVTSRDEAGEKYLCAYIVWAGTGDTVEGNPHQSDAAELRDYLAQNLPDYMVPAYFIPLEKIPVTPSGKVDRKALPAIKVLDVEKEYAPPRNEREKKLCQLWSEVLGLEEGKIGIDDNFFKLGGHSLKATILISKIHKTFNVKVTLGEIFNQPFIRGLSEWIKQLAENRHESIKPVEKKEYYPLSSAQEQLYIQQQMELDTVSCNMPMFFILEGELDRVRLAGVFRQLIRRHENLRTSFVIVEGEAVQRLHENIDFEIEYNEEVASFIRPFDLSRAPLLRVGLIHFSQEGSTRDMHLLMVDMHHIITDGISLAILGREFMHLYSGGTLPGLTLQYKDFSQWQNRLLESEEIKKQEVYWLKQFEGDIPAPGMPTDYPRPDILDFSGEYVFFQINKELTARINKLVLETETTLHVVLLAVCNILFSKYTGGQDFVVGNVVAGRQHSDLENIIGVFVNMLAMRNRPAENKTFRQFLEEVRENALNAYANQDYQFEEMIRKLNLQGNPSGNPLFNVAFQTQNMDIPEIQIPGLTFKPYESKFRISHFDLVISCFEEEDWLDLRIAYSPALFKESTIQQMARHFIEILAQVLENIEIKLAHIEISTKYLAARPTMRKEEVQFKF
jgi:amino acid adenylation domain-containing protein